MTKAIPDRYGSVTPGLVVDGGSDALEFYERAFGAEVVLRLELGGRIMHAEMRIGDSLVMLSDEMPEYGIEAPDPEAPVPARCVIYCEDADALHARAVEAGATEINPVADQFHGDRAGSRARPVRPPLGDRDAHRGHVRRGDAAAHGGGDGTGVHILL